MKRILLLILTASLVSMAMAEETTVSYLIRNTSKTDRTEQPVVIDLKSFGHVASAIVQTDGKEIVVVYHNIAILYRLFSQHNSGRTFERLGKYSILYASLGRCNQITFDAYNSTFCCCPRRADGQRMLLVGITDAGYWCVAASGTTIIGRDGTLTACKN